MKPTISQHYFYYLNSRSQNGSVTFLKQGGNGTHKADFVKPFHGNPIKLQSQPSEPVVGNTEQPLHMLLRPEPAATSAESRSLRPRPGVSGPQGLARLSGGP